MQTYGDELSTRYRLVAAAYLILVDADGRVLLHLRQGTGYRDGHWAVLAGHVETDESVFAAARREALEEAGVVVAAEDVSPLCTLHRGIPGSSPIEHRADFFFTASRWDGTPQVMEPDKAADMGFFALDALPEPCVPHERQVLAALASGPVPPIMVHGL